MRLVKFFSAIIFLAALGGCMSLYSGTETTILRENLAVRSESPESSGGQKFGDTCSVYAGKKIRGVKEYKEGSPYVLVKYLPETVDGREECPRGTLFFMSAEDFFRWVRVYLIETRGDAEHSSGNHQR